MIISYYCPIGLVCVCVCVRMCVCSMTMKYTVLSRIMARAFIPLQQLFTIYLNFNFLRLFETQHLILLDPGDLTGPGIYTRQAIVRDNTVTHTTNILHCTPLDMNNHFVYTYYQESIIKSP